MNTKNSRKVLLIGWDAADWKMINPLLDAGKMPNLQALVEGGVMGNLATLQPVLSPMLWSSIATGKRPYKHGIHGFSEPDPATGGIRPVTNLSRKTKAIWNILNQEDKHTITVGWWPSNPAEPLSRGVMVSNDYQTAHGTTYDPDKPETWPMKPGTVHPERLTDILKQLRVHPSELTEEDLVPFMPGLEGLTQEELDKVAKDPRIQSLMKIIADCSSIHCAATALVANEDWDFMATYYDAIDHFGHAFMKYHPPQREGIDDWDYRIFNFINEAGYIYHDMMLGTLVGLARQQHPDVTVVLMSDHGFHPDDFRLSNIPSEPAGPAAEHRQFGILVANGPGIKKDTRVHGANLLDLCPTLLHLFGLPVGEDMDGKVLLDIYEDTPAELQRIPSWDDVEGDHGMHSPDQQISPEDSKAALDQLVALGYIEEPDTDQSKAVEQTVRELDYNLAQAWADGGIFTESITIHERLYQRWPLEHRFGFKLAGYYQSLGRIPELRAIVEQVKTRRLQEAKEAVEEMKALKLDDEETVKAEQERIGKLDDKEKKKFSKERRDLIRRSRPNLFALRYYEATADFAEKDYLGALEKLQKLEGDFGARQTALTLRGDCHARLQQWDKAIAAYEEALDFDRETPAPLLGLARVYMARREFQTALEYARTSAGLLFFQPRAHYFIGLAHYRLGQFTEAEVAFLLAVRQAPLMPAVWRMLTQIAQFHTRDAGALTRYKAEQKSAQKRLKELKTRKNQEALAHTPTTAKELTVPIPGTTNAQGITNNSGTTIIVSGLPRSGTSLMMQILEAAGVPAYTDGKRSADDSNQRGYYEHDAVAALLKPGSDRSWLQETAGQALKVVAPLLPALRRPQAPGSDAPTPVPDYAILFMDRPAEEILASQEAMLKRLGKDLPTGDVTRAYQQHINNAAQWIETHNIPALAIDFPGLVHDPEPQLEQLATFLGCPDKLEAMRQVISPDMHRARLENT